MSNVSQTRQAIRASFDSWLELWQGNSSQEQFIANSVNLYSWQHGYLNNKQDVLQALAKDYPYQLQIGVSNVYIAGQADKAALSAYLYGQGQHDGQSFTFHGVIVMQFALDQENWLITQIRLVHGSDNTTTLPHWKDSQAYKRFWQPNDATAVIMSELDSPWALFPHNEFVTDNDEELIGELYSRYAWGLDFADFQLLADVFDDAVHSDLTPMGQRHSKRDVYGQLKAFRLAVPYLHHASKVLAINMKDSHHADVLLGRIISEQPFTSDGHKLYGAHYQMQVVKNADNVWRYQMIAYYPGWITANTDNENISPK